MSETEPIAMTPAPILEEERVRAARLRGLIDVAELGTWEVEFGGGTGARPDVTRRSLGRRPEEASRVTAWRARLHPADRARIEQACARACEAEGDGRFAAEYRVVHDDGSVHWLADR